MVTIPSPNVPFANRNIATESFRRGQQDTRESERHDLSQRTGEFNLETGQLERPSRLRSLDAQATTAESNARVSRGTEGARIRGASLQTAAREIEAFETVVDAIKTNDMAEVERRARMFYPNDDGLVQGILQAAGNERTRNILVQAEEFSKQFNDPRQRQAFIEEMIKEATADPNAAAAPGFMQGQASELGIGYGNPTATGTREFESDRKYQRALQLGIDPQTAFAISTGQRVASPQEIREMARKEVEMTLPKDGMGQVTLSPEEVNAAIATKYRELETLFGSARGGIPAPAAPGATGQPRGTGTQQDPFQAATQADIDWFRNSAPAGSVIVVDGAMYTK